MKKMYLLALISALICGFLLFTYLGKVKTSSETANVPRTEVLVAKVYIPAYADLTADMFALRNLPTEGLHAQAVTSFDQIEGKKSNCSFLADEVVLQSKFGEDVEAFASYRIPEGMRVMTVNVGSDSGLDQYLTPGDLVDVIFSAYEQKEDEEDATSVKLCKGVEVKETVTAVVLEAAEVFSTGSALDVEGVAYSTVSLILAPQDCLRLYASQNYGTFSLVLRGHNDDASGNTHLVNAEDILAAN